MLLRFKAILSSFYILSLLRAQLCHSRPNIDSIVFAGGYFTLQPQQVRHSQLHSKRLNFPISDPCCISDVLLTQLLNIVSGFRHSHEFKTFLIRKHTYTRIIGPALGTRQT